MIRSQHGAGPFRRQSDRRRELLLIPPNELVAHLRANVGPATAYCLHAVLPHLLRALELVPMRDALGQPDAVVIDDRVADEIELLVCPIVLGYGRRLFPEDMSPLSLELTEAKPYGSAC